MSYGRISHDETAEASAVPPALLTRLSRAVDDLDLGLSASLPLGLRASRALEQTGKGGRVDVDDPATVYRAIRLLEAL